MLLVIYLKNVNIIELIVKEKITTLFVENNKLCFYIFI